MRGPKAEWFKPREAKMTLICYMASFSCKTGRLRLHALPLCHDAMRFNNLVKGISEEFMLCFRSSSWVHGSLCFLMLTPFFIRTHSGESSDIVTELNCILYGDEMRYVIAFARAFSIVNHRKIYDDTQELQLQKNARLYNEWKLRGRFNLWAGVA